MKRGLIFRKKDDDSFFLFGLLFRSPSPSRRRSSSSSGAGISRKQPKASPERPATTTATMKEETAKRISCSDRNYISLAHTPGVPVSASLPFILRHCLSFRRRLRHDSRMKGQSFCLPSYHLLPRPYLHPVTRRTKRELSSFHGPAFA